jgi:hypothetical protein
MRIDFLLAGLLADHVDGGDRALGHVVVEALQRQLGVRIDPGNDEHRMALVGAPLDPGIALAQVEDVVLVDPGRDDQQRALVLFLGGRAELQQLDHLVLEDHLARRRGDVLAHFEGRGIGHLDAQLAAAFLDVAQQVVEALEQVLAVALDRFAQHFRVGQGEIRWRQRVDELAGEEVHLLARVLVEILDVGYRVVDVARGDQIGLLDEVEQEVFFPFGVGEALVALLRLGHGRALHAHHAQRGVLPQRKVVPHQVHLRLRQLVGIGQHLGHHVHEGLGDAEVVGGRRDALLHLSLHVLRDQVRGALGDLGIGLGDFLRIGQGAGFFGGHGDSLG